MCGILGSVNKPINRSQIDLISHRGPDSDGLAEFDLGEHKVYLAQTRLAIIDLSESGYQPMVSNCGNYAITFNGEIYNHQELRKKLTEIEFRGHSDTETILYYIKKYGIEGVKDFNGIFAFCFLDKLNKKLFLVRDFFGVKPIYYRHSNNELLFSSEIRPLTENYLITLNNDNLSTLLSLRYLPSPATLDKNILKIKPGHYIEISLNNETPKIEHGHFIEPVNYKLDLKFDEALIKYGEILENSIKRQLLADVEVGVLLSGGVDSAIVANFAQKHSNYKMKAFTIGFEGCHNEDEINDAHETAELIGLEHHTAKMSFDDFINVFKECTRIVEEPIATTSVIPMYFLSKLASKFVKVVITGQGADEPLGGYQRYQGELFATNVPKSIIKLSGNIIELMKIKNEKLNRASSSLGEKDDIQRFLNVYSVFSEKEIFRLTGHNSKTSYNSIKYFYDLLNCNKKEKPVDRMMSIDLRMNLADDLLLYTDKITMNFALECRVPMLDTELIKFIESLPVNYRVKRGKTKIIHKALANNILHEKIVNRQKKGFQSPTRVWFSSYEDKIKDLLLNKNHQFASIFNLKEVENIINQHQKGYNKERNIFLLLGIYFWLENIK